MDIFIIISVFFILALFWLNILASISLRYDQTLDSFQKKAQAIFVWLIPFIGASFVLRMVYEHSPEAIPTKLIPWPFKKIIYGRPDKRDSNTQSSGVGYDGGGSSGSSGDGGGGGGE